MTEETSLIGRPYIDRLSAPESIKNNDARIRSLYYQVSLFLETKFPRAFREDELYSLSPREFQSLLKRARKWIYKKAAFYYSGSICFLVLLGIEGYLYFISDKVLLAGFLFIFSTFGSLYFVINSCVATKFLLNKGIYDDFLR